MPEVILPCAHCRTDRHLSVQSFKTLRFTLFRVICTGCWIDGPAGDTRESAIEAHNALPRALTWTHEPPKVAGFYFLKMSSGTISMVYLSEQDIKDKDWHGCIGQWVAIAGPIAPPVEA